MRYSDHARSFQRRSLSGSSRNPAYLMATITIDRTGKQLVLTVQEYSLFAHRAVMNLFSAPRYWPEFLVQSDIIGFGSATIVLMGSEEHTSELQSPCNLVCRLLLEK